MSPEKAEIIICSGCLGRSDLGDVIEDVQTRLIQARPQIEWNLSTYSCFRFCPENKITISVSERMTMTRAASVDSIVNEVLSFFKIVDEK